MKLNELKVGDKFLIPGLVERIPWHEQPVSWENQLKILSKRSDGTYYNTSAPFLFTNWDKVEKFSWELEVLKVNKKTINVTWLGVEIWWPEEVIKNCSYGEHKPEFRITRKYGKIKTDQKFTEKLTHEFKVELLK